MKPYRHITLRLTFAALAGLFACGRADAQSGLRESLELLDRDNDGYIDPEEITPLARPYLERVARERRLSLDRSNRVDKWQEAARVYYALKNGADDDRVRTSRDRMLKGFGLDDETPVVPEFGLAEIKYPYTNDDLEEADETLQRSDRNRDGYLDRYEASRARWSRRDPFLSDLNKDDKLSRLELAQRYARRRMLSDDSGELIRQRWRNGSGVRPSVVESDDDRRRRERSEWWRKGGNRFWLTASVLERYDENRNGRLEFNEASEIGVPVGAIDADQDGELTRDELFAYFSELQDQTGNAIEGLPGWFYELDENRDSQIELTEFATELTDARVAEFVALDTNQDGLLAPAEILSSKSMMGGVFENKDAEMLPPKKTIVSEIEIEEDFKIADLNLRLTITHTNVEALDAYLTGPDGTRIELFTGVGGRDDHFEDTLFDDEARIPIFKARPPFEGSFQPEGTAKRQPGLSTFNEKSIQGVWQLTVRCSRSDRFGMLHQWSLIARPDEESLLEDPELASSIESPLVRDAMSEEDESEDKNEAENRPDQSRRPVAIPDYSRLGAPKKSFAELWTPERKAEFTARFKKPPAAEWEKLSDEEKKRRLEERSKAIAEYKRALAGNTLGATPRGGGDK